MIVHPLRGRLEGVCNTPLPIRIKNLIPIYWMNLKSGRFWGVCLCALPIRIKNLIPIYWINLKPGEFWDVCLCDQPRPGEKLLKFVWMHAKPGEDWTNMAIFTENPPRIGRKWPYLSKTRRELDEYGHIYRKPGGDWIQYGYSYRILAGDRIPYVSGSHIFGKEEIRAARMQAIPILYR